MPPTLATVARRIRRHVDALFWVALLAFVGWRAWPQIAAALDVGGAVAGRPAPDFALTTLDGAPVSRDALRGQVVLVNFWATWCPPCRLEMPGFQDVHDSRRARGFTIVGVSTDLSGEGHVRRWLAEHGITYPVAMAANGIVRDFGGLRGLPTSFLVDRQGRIRHVVTGYFAEPALASAVDRLLAEPAPPDVAPPDAPLPDAPTPAPGEGAGVRVR